MVDEKHLYDVHDHLPIPTYEEATSSRPTSQQSRLGPEEISDDAERQGLLGYGNSSSNNGAGSSSRRRNGYYQPPSVQSVRSSMDSDELELPEVTGGDEDEDGPALRREMEQMEMLDAEAADDDAARRARVRSRLSKRLSSLTTTLSSFQFPRLSFSLPRLACVTARIPRVPDRYRPGWSIVARLVGLFIVVSLIYLLFVSEVLPVGNGGFGQPFNPEWVRSYAQGSVDVNRIVDNLRHVTSYDHVAGSEGSLYLAKWIQGKFKAAQMGAVSLES